MEKVSSDPKLLLEIEVIITSLFNLVGTFEERLLVTVRCSDFKVVAGISFGLLPKTSSLYVSYMITDQQHRGQGFMKVL